MYCLNTLYNKDATTCECSVTCCSFHLVEFPLQKWKGHTVPQFLQSQVTMKRTPLYYRYDSIKTGAKMISSIASLNTSTAGLVILNHILETYPLFNLYDILVF